MKPTPENLARIRVLYRQPDTLALWGIPYDMRPGQQPRDIERGSERYNAAITTPPYIIPRPKYKDPHEGWIWLGQPGWWGSCGAEERAAVEAFLAGLPENAIPLGPCEWSRLADFSGLTPPVASFTSPGGRTFTVGPGEHWERFPDDTCWHDTYPILLDGEQVGKLFQSDSYARTADDRSRWNGSLTELRWQKGALEGLPRGHGYDVAAFDTAEECLKAWARSANQILDNVEKKR